MFRSQASTSSFAVVRFRTYLNEELDNLDEDQRYEFLEQSISKESKTLYQIYTDYSPPAGEVASKAYHMMRDSDSSQAYKYNRTPGFNRLIELLSKFEESDREKLLLNLFKAEELLDLFSGLMLYDGCFKSFFEKCFTTPEIRQQILLFMFERYNTHKFSSLTTMVLTTEGYEHARGTDSSILSKIISCRDLFPSGIEAELFKVFEAQRVNIIKIILSSDPEIARRIAQAIEISAAATGSRDAMDTSVVSQATSFLETAAAASSTDATDASPGPS